MGRADYDSVNDYIAAQPVAARATLRRVRATIRKALPRATERISYEIPVYEIDGRTVLYFAGYTRHYSIYPASKRVVRTLGKELEGKLQFKATLRFPLDEKVPTQLITRIAKLRAAEVRAAKAKKRPAPPRAELATELRKLARVLAKHEREVYGGLSPPATKHERTVLAERIFGEPELPAELATWFKWHNGGNDACLFDGYRPLSTMEAVDWYDRLRRRCRVEYRPWQDSWLPLFKCAGMYLLFETKSPRRGALLQHAEFLAKCPVVVPSLVEWARRETKKVEKRVLEASKKPTLARAQFEPIDVVELRVLQRAPIGTLVQHACELYSGKPGERVYVKSGRDRWQWIQDATLGGALSTIARLYSEARGGRDHFDETLANALQAEQTAGRIIRRAIPKPVTR